MDNRSKKGEQPSKDSSRPFNISFVGEEEPTETIDLGSMIPGSLGHSDGFDLDKLKLASFGKLMHCLSIPTMVVDGEGEIKFANEALLAMAKHDFDPEGKPFDILFRTATEAKKGRSLLQRVHSGRVPGVREGTVQVGRTRIWGRMHLRTMRLGGELMVLVQIENLSAQKELLTTQKYKKLVNIFPIGIAEFALSKPIPTAAPENESIEELWRARIVDGNAEFAKMYNEQDIQRLIGAQFGSVITDHEKEVGRQEQWARIGFPVWSFETVQKSDSRRFRHYENTWIGNMGSDLLMGFWWLKRDVTDKKKNEDDMLKAQKLESMGILAGGIAHDFNNLLTAILGNISLASAQTPQTHKSQDRMKAAIKAATRAQALTLQLLTFSKGGAPVRTVASIADTLKECASFALRGSNVRCEFKLPDDLWRVVMDEGQMGQVINNLIINAAQSMASGGVITVEAENARVDRGDDIPLKKGKYVLVSIVDTGCGIPAEQIKKVFDPYFTTKDTGSGLGLATSYSIIQKHEGLIRVESKIDQGSRFYFYLPASESETHIDTINQGALVPGKGRILVMDDEDIILDLLGELLETLGYEALYAANGEEAVEMYREAKLNGAPFDLVIMDLTVPGAMGGKEAMDLLLKFDPHVKAVVSSGYFNDPILSDPQKYGFAGVLPKPYDAAQLSDLISRALDGSPSKEHNNW
jgi:signal transduction histidine kinase/ActR/RegA family two-component response regulator